MRWSKKIGMVKFVFLGLFSTSISNFSSKKKFWESALGNKLKIKPEKSVLGAKKALTATQALVGENRDGEIRLLQCQKHL